MKERMKEMIAEYLGKDAAAIATDVTFTEMGIDSLDIAELVMQMEDEFGCSIEMSQDINTIDALAVYIENNK
ncbi:MAG TPA: acyl carrier protein [Lachnospiraceae bacterium]|jgi:acyl carrier protein|nr:acyl carrier protein [Lachnospiraceae bacterium]